MLTLMESKLSDGVDVNVGYQADFQTKARTKNSVVNGVTASSKQSSRNLTSAHNSLGDRAEIRTSDVR